MIFKRNNVPKETKKEWEEKYDTKCPRCNKKYNPMFDPDPCLNELPGVLFACCGHGLKTIYGEPSGVIVFINGTVVRGNIKIDKEATENTRQHIREHMHDEEINYRLLQDIELVKR